MEETIEYLPLVGEAMSLKTRRQRGITTTKQSLSEIIDQRKRKVYKRDCPRLTAYTIANHPKASDKQKKIAKMFLENENCPAWVEPMIKKIKISISRYC